MSSSGQPDAVIIQQASRPRNDVAALVESTPFGSDGLIYQRLNVQEQFERFNAPRWFHAMVEDELRGVYVLDRRQLLVDGQLVTAYYRGVLAVAKPAQGQGIGTRLTQTAARWLADQSRHEPIISYGCIDDNNKRSLRLLQSAGAIPGPTLSMYMMYRQWPAVRCDLLPVDSADPNDTAELSAELYADCRIRDVSRSTLQGYVLQDAEGIVVSARVAETGFRIHTMSSMARWCTRLFVQPFAPARRRFNPERFRYVSFSHVLIRAGCESQWHDFVSSVLAEHECHFGAVYLDPRGKLFQRLQRANRATRFLHSNKGNIHVVTRAFNDTANLQQHFQAESAPVHLWPIDA